jgi:hypothetical protein
MERAVGFLDGDSQTAIIICYRNTEQLFRAIPELAEKEHLVLRVRDEHTHWENREH